MKLIFSLTLILSGLSPSFIFSQIKLSPHQFDSLLVNDASVQLIDVRTSGERTTGYLKGSMNIDFSSDDFEKRLKSLDKNKIVAVYCAVGMRSGRTASRLSKMGFNKVYDLEGGLEEWQAQNKPLVKPKE